MKNVAGYQTWIPLDATPRGQNRRRHCNPYLRSALFWLCFVVAYGANAFSDFSN